MAAPALSASVPEADRQPDVASLPAVIQAALREYEKSALMTGQAVELAQARPRETEHNPVDVNPEAALNALANCQLSPLRHIEHVWRIPMQRLREYTVLQVIRSPSRADVGAVPQAVRV